MADVKNIIVKGGTIEVADVDAGSVTLPAFTGSNFDTVKGTLDGLSYGNVEFFTDMVIGHTVNNEQVLEVDDCNIGTLIETEIRLATLSFNWMATGDQANWAKFLGLGTPQSIASAPVPGDETVVSGSRGYNDPIVLSNQNGDGSLITITSITGGTDGALSSGTDFFVGENEKGQTVVTVIDSAGVTTESQDLVIVYNYTPSAQNLSGYDGVSRKKPFKIFRVTGCLNENAEQDIFYIYKASLDTEIQQVFSNLGREGQTYGSTALSFSMQKGGKFLRSDGTLTSVNT